MSKSGTTLREIAEAARVSVATVSYALNGKPGVSDAKRREIQRLLEKSGLKPKHLRNPAFFVCSETSFQHLANFNPFFLKYQGLNGGFHDHNVAMRLEFLKLDNGPDLNSQLQELASYKPGALVLDSDLGEHATEIAEFFHGRHVPTTQIGHTAKAQGVDAVIIDDFSGAYAGTKHLIDQGHTRIAVIRWEAARDPASAKKYAGFVCAMEEAGLDVRPEYVVESPRKREATLLPGRVAIDKLLALPESPTAVFVENTFVSAPLLYPIEGVEQFLPPEIAALDMVHFEAWDLGFVEQVMAGMLNYPKRKTKMLQVNWEQMGRVAAKHVVDLMTGQPASGEIIRLAPRLVEVDSVAVTPI